MTKKVERPAGITEAAWQRRSDVLARRGLITALSVLSGLSTLAALGGVGFAGWVLWQRPVHVFVDRSGVAEEAERYTLAALANPSEWELVEEVARFVENARVRTADARYNSDQMVRAQRRIASQAGRETFRREMIDDLPASAGPVRMAEPVRCRIDETENRYLAVQCLWTEERLGGEGSWHRQVMTGRMSVILQDREPDEAQRRDQINLDGIWIGAYEFTPIGGASKVIEDKTS